MAEEDGEYLRRLIDAVEEFEGRFEAWMETQEESDHLSSRGLMPTVWSKAEVDSREVRKRELDVAEAAGTAARAVRVTGAHIAVQGLGALDPISNWNSLVQPKALFTAQEVRLTASTVIGRLRGMLADADARIDSSLPGFAPSRLHPVIWAAAAAHWTTHQYRVAVREAAEALSADWKLRLDRRDVDDTVFWQQSLSSGEPTHDRPKIVWPGDASDKTVKSMRGGLEPLGRSLAGLAAGLNLTVRNPTTHERAELPEQEAVERLAAHSFLARLLDQCEIRREGAEIG